MSIGGEISDIAERPDGIRVGAKAWARNAAGEEVTVVRVEVTLPRRPPGN